MEWSKVKRVLFFLALIVIAYQMIGCTPNTKEAPDPLVVGFSQSGTESSWRKKHTESIITAREKEDYQVLYRNGYMNQERHTCRQTYSNEWSRAFRHPHRPQFQSRRKSGGFICQQSLHKFKETGNQNPRTCWFRELHTDQATLRRIFGINQS